MIRRLFPFACLAIDLDLAAALAQWCGGQDVIDADAEVLRKRQAAIVPVGEDPSVRMDAPQGVNEPELAQRLQGRASIGVTDDGVAPDLGIVDIVIGGGNVVVAAQGDGLVGTELAVEVATKAL